MNKVFKFIGVGLVVTLFDYLVYNIVVMGIGGGNTNIAWLGTLVAGVCATFLAFIMHSKITWRTRDPGKYGILKFFAWNALLVIAIRPLTTLVFGLLTGLYEFAFMITGGIGLPFSYEFVESTGIYILMTIVTMTLNFFFYDKIVFGKAGKNNGKEIDMEGVRQARKEEERQKKTKDSTSKKRMK